MIEFTYTHIDKDGMRWRFEGSRPVSELADQVMASREQEGDDDSDSD